MKTSCAPIRWRELSFTAGSGYTPGAGMESASVLVTDAGPPLPVVTLAAAADQVTEGTPARFTVSADRTLAADLTVNVAVSESLRMLSGTPPASVTIRAGAGAAALTLETDDDTEVEEDSTVTVAVQPGNGYQVGVPDAAGVRVVDNDRVPLVPLSFPYVVFDEPDERVDAKCSSAAHAGVGVAGALARHSLRRRLRQRHRRSAGRRVRRPPPMRGASRRPGSRSTWSGGWRSAVPSGPMT